MPKSTARRKSARQQRRLFEYGGQWIGSVPRSPFYYRFFYLGDGKVGRKSLGTDDLEDAKTALIRAILGDAPKKALSPESVHMAAVRNFYMSGHGDHIRSKNAAKRAFDLTLEYLKIATGSATPTVADFGLARQEGFWRWCRDRHGLSSKSIYTYASTLRAATNYCARPRIVVDSMGQEREAQILEVPFHIETSQAQICRVTGLSAPQPREFVPSDGQVAAFLDATYNEEDEKETREREGLFRFAIIMLNTWARPEAVLELDVSRQVDFERGTINMNPPGRAQTKKYRPTIRLTDCLRGWLLSWNLSRPITYAGLPVKKLSNKTFGKAAIRAGVPDMIPYSLRHYCNSRSMRVPLDIRPDREERATWMGHHDPRHAQTYTYEHHDPDYLERARKATDAYMLALDQLSRKSLFAPGTVRPGLHVVERRAER